MSTPNTDQLPFEASRAHARRSDPVTSDRAVKSITKDGTLNNRIWNHAVVARARGVPFNDSELTIWIENETGQRQQRNVIARSRGLMERAGLLRQAGIRAWRNRELMHYEIHPDNPKENP